MTRTELVILVTLVVTSHVPPAPSYFEQQKSTRSFAVLIVPGPAIAEQVSDSGRSIKTAWDSGSLRVAAWYTSSVSPDASMLPRDSRLLSLVPSIDGLGLTVEHEEDNLTSQLLPAHRSKLMLRLTRLRPPQPLTTLLRLG